MKNKYLWVLLTIYIFLWRDVEAFIVDRVKESVDTSPWGLLSLYLLWAALPLWLWIIWLIFKKK